MKPISIQQIIDKKRYNTETAVLLVGDDYWDGHNFERSGRNRFLYKTIKGAYFTLDLTQWQGENDTITPISQERPLKFMNKCLRREILG